MQDHSNHKAHDKKEEKGGCCSTHKHDHQGHDHHAKGADSHDFCSGQKMANEGKPTAHGSCCSTHKQEETKEHAHGACCSTHKHEHHVKASVDAPAGTVFVCPMHPQVRQIGPGSCPICGMALEPEVMTGEEGPSHDLTDMTRRFWIGLALTLPVFVLEIPHCANGGRSAA